MAGMAQSAVDSLLGRLSALLVDEAQLLRGVRGDVRFIRDEMESMNSLLAHLTEAEHRAHHVRTWMKQVVGLARDSEAYVELFARQVGGGPRAGEGLLGSLRRMLQFMKTIPVRHRVATRIRELKDRVREVGERRVRYGVTVSSAVADQRQGGSALTLFDDVNQVSGAPGGILGCSLLKLDNETLFNKGIDKIVFDRVLRFNYEEPAPTTNVAATSGGAGGKLKKVARHLGLKQPSNPVPPGVRICRIVWENEGERDMALADRVAQAVYGHPSLVTSFGCRARARLPENMDEYYDFYKTALYLRELLVQVDPTLVQAAAPQDFSRQYDDDNNLWAENDNLVHQIQRHLRGHRFLILLEHVCNNLVSDCVISSLLGHDGGFLPGSTIITTSGDDDDYYHSHLHTIIKPRYDIYRALYKKAKELTGSEGNFYAKYPDKILEPSNTSARCSWRHVQDILDLCYPDAFAMKMFLHLLQANPRRTDDELQSISDHISRCIRLNKSISKQMLIFCYNDLPSKYKSSLMYLSIFPKGRIITRTSLARRWIAEGIINPTREYYTSTEEGQMDNTTVLKDIAKHHFEMLVARGFILPMEISDACNIKTCKVHHEISEFTARIATDVNFLDTDMPQGLAQHLSIHNRIAPQACHPPPEAVDSIVASLPYLAKSSQWKLLKVLDLEGCRGVKKNHLKIICKILLLRYFSLRNTDVTQLPKQIEMLTCLETLDIRQTAVTTFATKSVVLPMLKHMLAGQTETHHPSASNNSDCMFQESLVAVRLPNGVERMKNLEMLSHVEVSNHDDITGISQLVRLRKLGVILRRKNRDSLLKLLFQQIGNLDDRLRSLSIQINHQVTSDGVIIHDYADEVHALASPPKLLGSLNIGGIRSGLLPCIDQLVKLTLSETYLGEDALRIIGSLRVVACLRLVHKSYNGSKLHIKRGELSSLKSLIVRGSEITSIQFDHLGASPKLETIVWSFAKMEAMGGLVGLSCLKKVELNPDPVRKQVHMVVNRKVDFMHNGLLVRKTRC